MIWSIMTKKRCVRGCVYLAAADSKYPDIYVYGCKWKIMVRECEKGEEELNNVNVPTVAVWITTYYIVERRVPSLEKDIGERFSIWLSLSSKSVQLSYIFRNPSVSYEIVCGGREESVMQHSDRVFPLR
jgi:hypothetical protein